MLRRALGAPSAGVGLLALLAMGVSCRDPAPPPEVARPRLVVLVVVDQLPTRLLDAARPRLQGGLARLVSGFDGAATYAHAITFTCPGHATIATGASPSVHGIVSNGWRQGGEEVYCGDVGLLRVETLADRVEGKVASLSLKDRGAVLLGGRSPELLSWFHEGAFVGLDVDVARHFGAWSPLHADYPGPDDGPFEHDPGIGTRFPHAAPPDAGAFLHTPGAGGALTDAAIAAVDRLDLGGDAVPDLLTVSYSQTDYIGHAFTAESWEALDALLRLDQDLGRLFAHLDARAPYAVVLTSDHGVAPVGGARVSPDAVRAAGGEGAVFADPTLYLPPGASAAEVARAVSLVPGIAGAWPRGEGPEAVRESVDAERSGEVYVLLAEGALYDWPKKAGRGTSHGTPYDYDRRVPLLAWGAGVRAGTGEADVRQVAPTLARLLGVAPPAAAALPPVPALLAP